MNIPSLDLLRNAALFRKQYHVYVSNAIKDSNLNISSAEFGFLKELIHTDGVIQEVLVQNTCIDKAATSRIIKSLEQKNLIIRVKNETDKRSLKVFLTSEGKELVPVINNILQGWYLALTTAVGEEKVELFISLFTELNENHPK